MSEIYKIGSKFIITAKPKFWNSRLNPNEPLDVVKYPYYGTIKGIDDNTGLIAMTDGFYGWSLSSLIEENKIIIIDIKEERKKKLNKIYEKNET